MGNLVLTRRVGESVILSLADGTRIEVAVAEFRQWDGRDTAVRLAIHAPQSVVILRSELESQGGR